MSAGISGKTIDVHTHLSEHPQDLLIRFAHMNGLRYNLEELTEIMRQLGIHQGLLMSPPLSDGSPLPNRDVIKLCERSGGLLKPVVTVEPTTKHVNAAIKAAEEKVGQVKAFKVRLGYIEAFADDPVFNRLYDFAESHRIPILFHTGDTATRTGDLSRAHPLTLDKVANKRDNLLIVLCHFGNPWFEDAAELIYKHPTVYADMSGLTTGGEYAEQYENWVAKRISEAIYYAGGANKILFGSDYPVTRPSDALSLVKKLQVEEHDKEKILWGNAEKLFGL